MTTREARKLYGEAWNSLFDLVLVRNNFLQRLDMMARPAMDATPAGGMVFEFDTARARALLAEIDELTPEQQREIRRRQEQLRRLNRQDREMILQNYRVYQRLTPEQRLRLENSYGRFKSLPPARQQELRNIYRQFLRMSPERRARMLENLRLWQQLTPEQRARLREVIVIDAVIPVVGSALDTERRFGKVRLLLPLAVAVRLVAQRAPVVAVHAHGAVSVVAVSRTPWTAGGTCEFAALSSCRNTASSSASRAW